MVSAVFVYLDALHLFGVNISGNVRAFVDHKNRFSGFLSLMCEDGTVKSGADH